MLLNKALQHIESGAWNVATAFPIYLVSSLQTGRLMASPVRWQWLLQWGGSAVAAPSHSIYLSRPLSSDGHRRFAGEWVKSADQERGQQR